MNQLPDHDWQPDAQLLAAYFDGELDDRADDGDLRTRIEGWLRTHPEAAEESEGLQKLWQDTTPAEPSAASWRNVLSRIEAQRRAPRSAPASKLALLVSGAVAAGIILFVGLTVALVRSVGPTQKTTGLAMQDSLDLDVLPVALASEITILRMEGADTDAVVVGAMPVSGDLELAVSGEVCIECKCPRVVVRQDPPHRPMVWAVAKVE